MNVTERRIHLFFSVLVALPVAVSLAAILTLESGWLLAWPVLTVVWVLTGRAFLR